MTVKHFLFAALIAVAASFPAAAQTAAAGDATALPPLPDLATVTEVDPLIAATRQALDAEDFPRVAALTKRLMELRPHNGNFALEHAAAMAAQGDKSATYDALLKLHATGWGFDIGKDPRFEKVRDTEVWSYIVDQLAANLAPKGEGKVAFRLPADDLMVEALTWDPTRKEFIAGSVRNGTIYRVASDGALTAFIKPDVGNGLWGVYDLAVDAKRNRLWVATMASAMTEGAAGENYGRAAVLSFELDSGEPVGRFLPPADGRTHLFPSIAVSPAGDVFVADSLNRSIWRVEGRALRPVVENARLTRVRALTVSEDGKTLYFADYSSGLFGIDIASGKPFVVGFPRNVSLFGIESLYSHGPNLIAVQNAMTPQRIVRIELTPDGRNAARLLTIDSGHKAFEALARGVRVGDRLFVIANTQRGRYTPLGNLADGAKLDRIAIWEANLDAALAPPAAPMTIGGR